MPRFLAFLPRFFAFPFALRNLWKLLALAATSQLVFHLPLEMPFNYLATLGPALAGALWQAFKVMDLSAYGRIDVAAQRADFRDLPERVALPIKTMFVYMGLFALAVTAACKQADYGWGIALLISFLTPAILMRLYASNRIFNSLKPQHWLRYIQSIGAPYFALWLVLLLAASMPALWQHELQSEWGEIAWLPTTFLFLYFNLMLFHMMGFILFAYHEPLGLSEQLAFEEASTAGGDEISTDALIATRLEHGQIDAAIAIARNALHRDPERIKAHERLYRLLLTAGDKEGAKAQSISLLSLAIRQGRSRRALSLYKDLQTESNFSLQAPQVLPLAQLAVQEGDFSLAVSLLSGFDKRFPGHADIPMVYLYSAQLIHARFGKRDLAQSILETLLKRYPDHALAPEAKRVLASIQSPNAG